MCQPPGKEPPKLPKCFPALRVSWKHCPKIQGFTVSPELVLAALLVPVHTAPSAQPWHEAGRSWAWHSQVPTGKDLPCSAHLHLRLAEPLG